MKHIKHTSLRKIYEFGDVVTISPLKDDFDPEVDTHNTEYVVLSAFRDNKANYPNLRLHIKKELDVGIKDNTFRNVSKSVSDITCEDVVLVDHEREYAKQLKDFFINEYKVDPFYVDGYNIEGDK